MDIPDLGVHKCSFRDVLSFMGHTPSTAGTFRKKLRKNSGKTPEMLSERFLEFPSRVRLGSPKPYNSRHLRPSERFQNYLPPSTAGDASFFRSDSGEGLSELVMEFPASTGSISDFNNHPDTPADGPSNGRLIMVPVPHSSATQLITRQPRSSHGTWQWALQAV